MSWEIVIPSVIAHSVLITAPSWPGQPQALDKGPSVRGLTARVGETDAHHHDSGGIEGLGVIVNSRENIRREEVTFPPQTWPSNAIKIMFRPSQKSVGLRRNSNTLQCGADHDSRDTNMQCLTLPENCKVEINLRRMNQGEGQATLCWLWPLCFVSVLLFSSSGKSLSCFSLGFKYLKRHWEKTKPLCSYAQINM